MSQPSRSLGRLTALFALFTVLAVFAAVVYVKSKEQPAATSQETEVERLSLAAFADKVLGSDQVIILDVRPKTEYITEHIPNSISIPGYELSTRTDELTLFKDWEIIIVCASDECPELSTAARTLRLNGFEKLFALEGGFDSYTAAELSTSSQARLVQDDLLTVLQGISVPELSVEELKALEPNTYMLVDSRTPYEFVTGFIPGAIDIPLHATSASMEQGLLPKDKLIIVYDRVGNRSQIAVQSLLDAGYEQVKSLSGGIEAWKESGGKLDLVEAGTPEFEQRIPVLETNE